jgi:hypothetical protein
LAADSGGGTSGGLVSLVCGEVAGFLGPSFHFGTIRQPVLESHDKCEFSIEWLGKVESRHYTVYVRLLAQSSDVAPATRRLAARTSISPRRRPSGLKSGWESRPTFFSKSVGRPAVNRGVWDFQARARTATRAHTPTRVPVAAGFGVTVPVPIPSPG